MFRSSRIGNFAGLLNSTVKGIHPVLARHGTASSLGTERRYTGTNLKVATMELVTAANVTKASTGEFQEKLTNEGPRNRREGSKSALPGEKKCNLEIVSKLLKKKPPVTLELLSTTRRELPEQHRLPQRSTHQRR
ncbi:ribosome biogenesis regulatory protein [Culex quinquefasciatus]|uniref:Ribosome biogenesis regulatory protein n=1 Tax=Culex quinquefasciatus TaxID=7176 RepID=B0X614_CULQU|nr:ribosome biogenesis regulatory protein [Culex quinquefasciatus]|eukprot:XP_001865086.1 ribosome biogenesis regulatory protein [Culex quinquefasciatus]